MKKINHKKITRLAACIFAATTAFVSCGGEKLLSRKANGNLSGRMNLMEINLTLQNGTTRQEPEVSTD